MALKYGYVVGEFIEVVGDRGPNDADRYPDQLGATGTIKFTPDVASITDTKAGNGRAVFVTPRAVEASLDANGVLIDANGLEGVWLVAGLQYSVRASFLSGDWKVVVSDTNTLDNPLDIVRQMPLLPSPSVRFVLSEQTLTDAQAAADRALAAALRAEAAAGGGGAFGVASVNSRTGAVVLSKADVGLTNVANTAPADLPVSTAVSTELVPLRVGGRLGVTSKNISGTDLNNWTGNGWGAGNNLTNSPDGSNGFFYVKNHANQAADNYFQQQATKYGLGGNSGDSWVRYAEGQGVYTPWVKMADSVGAVDAGARAGLTTKISKGQQSIVYADIDPTIATAINNGSAAYSALAAKADLVNGVIPTSQIPAIALMDVFPVTSQAAMLASAAQKGDIAIRSDIAATYILNGTNPAVLSNWIVLPTPSGGGGAVSTVNGQTGTVVLGKADIGLGNVDNTSDANKPISTATATALAGKAASTHTHTASQISDATTVGKALMTATDAAAARTAIGATGAVHPAISFSGTTVAIDGTGPTTQVVTLTGTTTVSIGSAPAAGGAFQSNLVVKQDGTGSRTITWPSVILWPGGTPPTLSTTPNAVDRIQLTWDGIEWLGTLIGAAFSRIPTATTKTIYTMSTTAASTAPFATEGTVTASGGTIRLAPPATAWANGIKAILATTDNNNGNSTTGAPAVVADMEATFNYSLLDLSEQYPTIGLRTRSKTYTPSGSTTPVIDDLWTSGGGSGMFKIGYLLQLSPSNSLITLYDGGTTTQIVQFPFTFPSKDMKWRIKISGKTLYIRIWAAANVEPTTWTYQGDVLYSQIGGALGFTASNGPAAVSKTVTISNLVVTTPIITMQPATPAPAADPTGFTRIYTENFNIPATTGTGTGSVLATYGTSSLQFYNDEGVYWPRATTSVHDGVLDVNLPGDKGAAFIFGGSSIAYNRVGGRFAYRAMAIDAIGNGTATMVWPSSEVWKDGEIDYPESNFEDTPFVHHHSMVAGQEATSQDYNTAVSWRDWHVYAVEWYPPGTGPTPATGSVRYFVDEVLVYTVTTQVPTTAHRYMFQIGNYGQPGHFLIDWVTISAITS